VIRSVSANQRTFKNVQFTQGFNVVLAERTKESTKKDSRNGLGKTTLIEIIHFCLGASVTKGKWLMIDVLKDWEFSIETDIDSQLVKVTRSLDEPTKVRVDANTETWPIKPTQEDGVQVYNLKDWNSVLGSLLFGLREQNQNKYRPSFRALISYFIRRGKEGFISPFEHHRKQKEWDKQVHNSFLLGLSPDNAADLQVLKDRKKGLDDLWTAAKSGALKNVFGSLGDLEAQRIQLSNKAAAEEEQLSSFKVHPQYESIRVEANRLTEEIHDAVNQNFSDSRMLDLYRRSIEDEQPPESELVEKIYKEAGLALPDKTLRTMAEVQQFHRKVLENRRSFLQEEISRLQFEIARREESVVRFSDERASLLQILQTHGALEEYTKLQNRHTQTVSRLQSVIALIDDVRKCESGRSEVKIELELAQQRLRRDYEERAAVREKAIRIFNTYSERLYDVPGKL
jgi:uncharacterized protein YydD (DUF2326 family)